MAIEEEANSMGGRGRDGERSRAPEPIDPQNAFARHTDDSLVELYLQAMRRQVDAEFEQYSARQSGLLSRIRGRLGR